MDVVGCILAGLVLATITLASPASADDTAQGTPTTTPSSTDLPKPRQRDCCVFGYDLRTELGGTSMPMVVANVVDPLHLGAHSYLPPLRDTESNGELYTCRGGFIDVAHVRDYADWTRFLYERILPVLGSDARIEIPYEGAKRAVQLRSFAAPSDPNARRDAAVVFAQRIAFHLSVWHEIVTWYDFRSMPMFPERISSFSPEDVFSNTLGIVAGGEALRSGKPYDAALDHAIASGLKRLDPLTPSQTRKTFDEVDGVWWDHRKKIPNFRLVTRRMVWIDPVVKPWLVPEEHSPHCRDRKVEREELRLPAKVGDQSVDELYELRFEIDQTAVAHFPRPPVTTPYFTQAQFPYFVARIREEIRETFGPLAEVPWSPSDEQRQATTISETAPGRCGPLDPECANERKTSVAGSRVLVTEVNGGFPGVGGSITVIRLSTLGGGFDFLPVRASYDVIANNFLMRAEAVRTLGILSLCRQVDKKDPKSTEIAFPWVNVVDPDCLSGSRFGLRLDLADFIYDGRRKAYGLRPIELGFVWNIFGNGYSPSFRTGSLLWSLNVAPEVRGVVDHAANLDFVVNSRMEYTHRFWGNRIEINANIQGGLGLTSDPGAVVESNVGAMYHWLIPYGRPNNRLSHLISFGLTAGLTFWPTPMQLLAPLNGRGIFLPNEEDPVKVRGLGMLFIETSLSKIRMK